MAGAWSRRAYFDEGTLVGSIRCPECKIDSIAQSWAVLAGGAKEKRIEDAMLAMERYLWNKDEGLFKLFTPPFNKSEKHPGYIKGYIPGCDRKRRSVYHAAIWAVLMPWLSLKKERKRLAV